MKTLCFIRRLLGRPSAVDGTEILGACDRAALESALALSGPEDEVVAIALGKSRRQDRALKLALSLGCGRAIRIYDQNLDQLDAAGVATVLAASARHVGFDVIVCGDRSQDWATGAVGPMMAEILGLPALSGVRETSRTAEGLQARIRHGGRELRFQVQPPALLTVRSAHVPEAARKPATAATIEILDLKTIDLSPSLLRKHMGKNQVARTRKESATLFRSADALVERLTNEGLWPAT